MSNRWSLKDLIHKWPVWNSRKPWAYGGLFLGLVILVSAVLIFLFKGPIINGYGKGKLERDFAKAYPGCSLRIGKLEYSMSTHRLVANAVTLQTTASALKAGQVSLTGISWLRFLRGKPAHEILVKASADALEFEMEFPRSHYRILCKKLRAVVPVSELMLEGLELQSTIKDEERFAADAFRTTRFHVVVPECSIVGLAYADLLQEKSYRARKVHLSRLSVDALVNRDKPVKPSRKPPLMVNEALAAIGPPVQIDNLSITSGHLRYAEQVVARAAPGVLTITEVNLDAEGITNQGGNSAEISLNAQGKLMDAGEMRLQMHIPLNSPKFSLRYSGSLGAMDLTRLDAFLDIAEHIRIKSGRLNQELFKIEIVAGQAHGQVRASYQDLKVAVLDTKTGKEKGLDNRIASFIANNMTFEPSSAPRAVKEGKVDYRRGPNDTFIQVVWFSLRSGALKAIHR